MIQESAHLNQLETACHGWVGEAGFFPLSGFFHIYPQTAILWKNSNIICHHTGAFNGVTAQCETYLFSSGLEMLRSLREDLREISHACQRAASLPCDSPYCHPVATVEKTSTAAPDPKTSTMSPFVRESKFACAKMDLCSGE